jgi:two-component system, cell cycle response regulator DivK
MNPNALSALGLDHVPLMLIADPDPDTRGLYAGYLHMTAGCRIEEAGDGREALAKAISRHPDVVVTETRLPGLSGYDLCALLRCDTETTATPVIFVTGDAFTAETRRAERAGADAVLTKPCLPDRLLAEIRTMLARSSGPHQRTVAARAAVAGRFDPAGEATDSRAIGAGGGRRVILSRSYDRRETTEPPLAPPALVCPTCDMPLQYLRSHVGGVSARHAEQWDYFECTAGCGTFQYRERTRKIRKV